ncbi:MAG: hypothetical protein ACYSUX_19020, partial [Planctomycetota bacterium]
IFEYSNRILSEPLLTTKDPGCLASSLITNLYYCFCIFNQKNLTRPFYISSESNVIEFNINRRVELCPTIIDRWDRAHPTCSCYSPTIFSVT